MKLQGVGYNLSLPVLNPKRSENEICETASRKFETAPDILLSRLSFSHLKEIMMLDDPFERFFYEFECIKGTWSVKMVEYALSGMDNSVFVSTYKLQLPDKKQLEEFLIKEIDELGLNT